MNRVVEKYLPSCHSFLAVIFAQVNWLEWIKHLTPSMISKGFGILLNLTVRLANDCIAREVNYHLVFSPGIFVGWIINFNVYFLLYLLY